MSGLLVFIACALSGSPALAEAPSEPETGAAGIGTDASEVVEAVQSRYADVQVMRADFVQVSRSALYGDEEQRGSLVLQRPRKMRWKFAGTGKQFVTDGDTMWIYNPADKQVLRFRDFSAQASAADQLLQSLHKVSELFEVEVGAGGGEGAHTLKLTPKDEAMRAQVKAVKLTLGPEYLMRELVITDAYDSVTELTFSNVRLGGTVDQDTFEFTIPDGVEVIDSNAG